MKKKEIISKYGKEAYEKILIQRRDRYRKNAKTEIETTRNWQFANPKKVAEIDKARSRKEGHRYKQHLRYETTGVQGARNKVRRRHGHLWQSYKRIIAPLSQIHHEWIPGSSNYNGVALVEKERHQHGIIDVIQILDGDITLFSEKEIRER